MMAFNNTNIFTNPVMASVNRLPKNGSHSISKDALEEETLFVTKDTIQASVKREENNDQLRAIFPSRIKNAARPVIKGISISSNAIIKNSNMLSLKIFFVKIQESYPGSRIP